MHSPNHMRTFEGHDDWVTCVVTVDELRFLSGSRDGTAKLWNAKTGKCIGTHKGDRSHVVVMAKVDDERFVMGSGDNLILWNISAADHIGTF